MIDPSFSTVIFDMDGVIADTQRLHAQAEHELLKQRGIHLDPEEITVRFGGVAGRVMFETVFREHQHNEAVDEIIREKRELMAAHDGQTILPIPGVPELIEDLKQSGWNLGVASASGPKFVEKVLTIVGVKHLFDHLTSAQEVARGKPAPDIFLLAAEKIGAAPTSCIVIEDSHSGMTAAKAAGMACIGFVPPHLDHPGRSYPADRIIDHMDRFNQALLLGL